MSNRNAASLTGSLLVRKGAAAPSPFADEPQERGAQFGDGPQGRISARTLPRLAANDPAGAPAKARRFTLRLSPEEHLRLRLASVYLGCSGQKLVLEAVNEYLGRVAPELSVENCTRTFGRGHPHSPIARG